MIDAFVYDALPMRVRFGIDSLSLLEDEIDQLGARRVLLLTSPELEPLARRIATTLGPRAAEVLAEAQMHVPVDLARRAADRASEVGADACVVIGGGSAIGLGKAIALERGLPIVAVPTTYAGSEMTPVWGLTDQGCKRTGRDRRVLPRTVIYDPKLTVSLPTNLSVTSGFNAIAHAVEALYAPDRSPVIALMAEEGVRTMLSALSALQQSGPSALGARSQAQYSAWLCGACLGATTMSLHHKLCHVLGGMLNLPHSSTHAVVLPHSLAYNQDAAPDARAALQRATGNEDPASALWSRSATLGAPRSLAELGMARNDVAKVVQDVIAAPYANPAPLTHRAVTELLLAAWDGAPPEPPRL